ncbi:hypothetical protein AgCh_028266 [Apium graveolens]
MAFSGGHGNPAVTLGMAIGGHVSISAAIFYWISQILGSVMPCLLLKITTVGQSMLPQIHIAFMLYIVTTIISKSSSDHSRSCYEALPRPSNYAPQELTEKKKKDRKDKNGSCPCKKGEKNDYSQQKVPTYIN